MTLPPIQLAWVGFVCDRILHRARIVWDLYRYTGDPELAKRARELGRYALSVLCPMARVMIHEAGHTFMGSGGHCEFGGCFDIASNAWYCRVRGRLGLPPEAWDSGSIAGTWRGGRYYLDPSDLARVWAADFGGTRHIVAEEADQCGTCDSLAREEWWLRTYLSAYAAVAGPPGLLPLDSIEWYSAARAFYQSRVDSARGACHLDWTCDLEAIGQPRGASTFCLQDAWARFWLKDAEDVASYRVPTRKPLSPAWAPAGEPGAPYCRRAVAPCGLPATVSERGTAPRQPFHGQGCARGRTDPRWSRGDDQDRRRLRQVVLAPATRNRLKASTLDLT